MPTGEIQNPYRGYNFRVELDNTDVAGFSEVSGLTFNVESVEYREGTDGPLHVRKLPGLRSFNNITLRRGYTDNTALYDWYRAILNGQLERRNGAIILQDEEHNDVYRWEFQNAWITTYEGPSLNATNNEVVIENLELVVERVELA